jgi:hypothetical protein
MGTNYLGFILEGLRITKMGGVLIIAEVVSRIPNLTHFIGLVKLLGFRLCYKV